MDCSLPGSSIHGIFQARVLEWVAIAFSNCPPEQRLNLTPVLFLYNHKSFIHRFSKFFICHPPTPQTYSSSPSLEKASHMSFLDFIYVFRSDQSLSCVRLFATPWIVARQASLSITNSRSSLKLTSIESVMLSSHLIFCRPHLLLPPILPRIRVLSNESTLRMRWPKYWCFSFSI